MQVKRTHIIGCFCIILFSTGTLFAQKQYNYFYGKVLESGTRKALQGVNLTVKGTRFGTVTDKTGAFSFFTDSIPARLVVSHVGYETKTVVLDTTSFKLTLYLSRKVTELQEVEIRAPAVEPFFRDQRYAVLDYEIDSGLIYLLIYRNSLSNSQMICKSQSGDTMATSAPFTFRPERLFKDCLGTMHLLSHDSGFQVFRHEKELSLIYPVNLKKFDDVLKGCVAATPQILFFQRTTNRGMGVEFYGVNRKTFERKSISQVTDEQRARMLRRNADDARLLGSPIQPDSRDDFVSWNYVHKILYRPIRTALYRIGDFICIFNTPERQAEFYDSAGNYSYKLALQVDKIKSGRWTSEVLSDPVSGKVYTTFLQNGKCFLYEINLNNGELKRRLSLSHSYPEKIRVYDGSVYYLYDVTEDPDNKMLFRQRF